jgi:hypothetical protein
MFRDLLLQRNWWIGRRWIGRSAGDAKKCGFAA